MSMSDYLETAVLNAVFRGVTFPTISTVYFALFTSAPSDSGGGTEVTGGSYARVAVTANTSNFTAPADDGAAKKTTNAGAITFPAPTADWGTVTHVVQMDASSGGNMLYWEALGTSRNILNGDGAPSFATGAFSASQS